MSGRAEPFDPAPLVAAAQAQHPDEPWLADALARCTTVYPEGRAYAYTIPPTAGFRAVQTFTLETRSLGPVVVDVLEGRRIGGLEFLKRL